MSIKAQADALGFSIIGQLTRVPERDPSRTHLFFADEAGNAYIVHLGVLTIVAADGSVY